MREKVISAYEIPEAKEGDIYVRVPTTKDKAPSTKRIDRETGEYITLWEEKLRYPYKTRRVFKIIVNTTECLYTFTLKMDEDGTYYYNGSNIPSIAWTLLELTPGSPEGMVASLAHDNILQYKQYFYDIAKACNPDLTVRGFLYLTTNMYKQLLLNKGVSRFKANIMGFFINVWQVFFNKDWNEVK